MARILSIRIGKKYVKICELQYSSGNSVYVNRILKAKLPEGVVEDGFIMDFYAAEIFLRSILTENSMTATDVIFSISSSKIASKEVSTPIMNKKRLVEMIDANASEYFPVYLEDYILAHTVLDKGNPKKGLNTMRVLVLAAPKDLIDDYYKLAERLKLNVKSIDYAGNSAYQMIRRQIDSSVSLVIQIQEENTTVNILNDNILKLQRVVPYGKNLPLEALCNANGIDEDEATTLLETERYIHETFDGDPVTESIKHLFNNILRVVDYYNSRYVDEPIEKAYLVGESVSLLGIENLFANEFNFPVMEINKFHGVKLENENELLHRIVTKYVGCLGAGIASVDFMPKETLEKIKNINSFRMLKIGVIGSLAAGVLFCAIPLTQIIFATAEQSNIQKKIDRIKDIEKVVDDYYDAHDIYYDAAAFKDMSDSNNDSLINFITELELTQPSDIAISNITVKNGQVSITGTTSVKPTIAKYITQLKGMSNVADVFVSTLSETKDENGVITTKFTLACLFKKLPDYVDYAETLIGQNVMDFESIIRDLIDKQNSSIEEDESESKANRPDEDETPDSSEEE